MNKLSMDKLIKPALAAGLLAVVLIFLSGLGNSSDNTSDEQQLEQRLCDMICAIAEMQDTPPPKVMIRLGDDKQTVLGAAIVCSKADNPIVKAKILDIAGKTLGLTLADISIES